MTVQSISSALSVSFLSKITASSNKSSSVPGLASTTDATQFTSSQLRTSARIFSSAVQNLNQGVSLLNASEDVLVNLDTITEKAIKIADRATQAGLSAGTRSSLNSDFVKLANQFRKELDKSSKGAVDILNPKDLATQLKTLGLDSTKADRLATIFSKFLVPSGTTSLGSDQLIAPRPITLPTETVETDGPIQLQSAGAVGPTGKPAPLVTDLNGDGKPDLVTSSLGALISARLGNGDGTFGAQSSITSVFGAGSLLGSGDYNNDGSVDLVADQPGGSAVVFLGNGDGTLQSGQSLATVGTVSGFASADFNNDGYSDLAVSYSDHNYVDVFLSNGDGTFASSVPLVTFQSGSDVEGVSVGDINEDGNQDLAFAATSDDKFNIYFGNGAGNFSPTGGAIGVGLGFVSPHLADSNNDGHLDLIGIGTSDGTLVSVLGDGTNIYGTETRFNVGSTNYKDLAVGDFNSDGKIDAALTGDNLGVSVLYGTGSGSFSTGISFTLAAGPELGIVAADLNGDGKKDLVIGQRADNSVAVFLQRSSPVTEDVPLKPPTPADQVFPTGRTILSRSDAYAALADLKNLHSELNKNIKSVNDLRTAVSDNVELARATGFSLLAVADQLKSAGSAESVASQVAFEVRSRGRKYISEAGNINPVITALLAGQTTA